MTAHPTHTRPEPPTRRVATPLVVTTVAVATAVFSSLAGGLSEVGAGGLSYALVGALLLYLRPGNGIARVLVAIGLLLETGVASTGIAVVAAAGGGSVSAVAVALAWYAEWYWVPFLYLMLVGLPLLLPSGRLHSRRGRILARAAVAAGVGATGAAMFQGTLLAQETATPIDNPLGWLPWADVDLSVVVFHVVGGAVVLGAVASAWLVARFRSARGIERQQLKVVALGISVTVGAFLVNALLTPWGIVPPDLTEFVAISIPAWAVLVAVTRFRLYEVDRLVSRTVTYAVVTTVLLGLYMLVAVVPATLLEADSDLLVAAATLVVAAAFQPLRRRVQRLVDRRFNRSRYDATLVVEQFAQRLRLGTDLGDAETALRDVVRATFQPGHVSLWVSSGSTT